MSDITLFLYLRLPTLALAAWHLALAQPPLQPEDEEDD